MKEVINDLLGYSGLKIIQRSDILNFSLDSTLLAYFVTIKSSDKKIIDLGCGNGPIPIFLTLRTKAHIYGIEIQTEICELASRSVELNHLENQITIMNMDIKDTYKEFGVSGFDVVICNPPYFVYQKDSHINKNDYLTIAKHEVKITLSEVLQVAKRLLKDGGTFAMIHRSDRLLDVLENFRKSGIEPKRMQFVYPKINSKSSLAVLIEGKKSRNKGNLKVLPPLYITDANGKYTDEVMSIFHFGKEEVLNETSKNIFK